MTWHRGGAGSVGSGGDKSSDMMIIIIMEQKKRHRTAFGKPSVL